MSDSDGRHWLRQLEADPGALRDDPDLLARLERLLLAALLPDQLEPLARRAWSELVGAELVQAIRTVERNSDAELVRVSVDYRPLGEDRVSIGGGFRQLAEEADLADLGDIADYLATAYPETDDGAPE